LGVVPMNVEAELIDVAAGAGHKWLMSPEGVGYLYLSDRARERVQPTLVGWISVPDPFNFENLEQGWNRGTLAWETGTGPAALYYGLRASLDLLTRLGTQNIAAHLETLTDHLCDAVNARNYEVVSSRRPGEKSQIVCIRHREGMSPMALYTHLKNRNIVTAPRGDRLRIAPHAYNLLEEIDALVRALP
ncbi:MAG TPA: aminotransferase class V-fold PLP-dependent enzyme, partial [Pyrinomonadaceae bacterium]|nr:aminotransferase class V-fold PLP-dependent enzyme [Pyrinomonadaceae bacterium]